MCSTTRSIQRDPAAGHPRPWTRCSSTLTLSCLTRLSGCARICRMSSVCACQCAYAGVGQRGNVSRVPKQDIQRQSRPSLPAEATSPSVSARDSPDRRQARSSCWQRRKRASRSPTPRPKTFGARTSDLVPGPQPISRCPDNNGLVEMHLALLEVSFWVHTFASRLAACSPSSFLGLNSSFTLERLMRSVTPESSTGVARACRCMDNGRSPA